MPLKVATEAIIFDVQGYSVHDGPGARTLVFFKGCPLNCYWCCNPESWSLRPQLLYRRTQCVQCYRCVEHACPRNAISLGGPGGYVTIARETCNACDDLSCTAECYHDALKQAGRKYTLDELMQKIERDRRFWGGRGGVTVSGGEMAVQYRFVANLLEACHESQIHTAVETTGHAPWPHYEMVLRNVDWLFADIKHMDSDRHKAGTGVGNELILDNLAKMARMAIAGQFRLVMRMPVVQGFNTDDENVLATAKYVRKIGVKEVNCLPFHRLGASKYEQLDEGYRCRDMVSPPDSVMKHIQGLYESEGITCYIGSDTPF
ncbi:MAG: glycyl-radical enzyme activating protein [Holophaga sp.]|nr:glycyl-radical enzyme activating protein [Holophaga sp.]